MSPVQTVTYVFGLDKDKNGGERVRQTHILHIPRTFEKAYIILRFIREAVRLSSLKSVTIRIIF